MGLWSYIKSLLSNDNGFMKWEGKELRWHRAAIPLPIFYTEGIMRTEGMADRLTVGVRKFNQAVGGRVLMFPDPIAVPELVDTYTRDPRALGNLIIVCRDDEPIAEAAQRDVHGVQVFEDRHVYGHAVVRFDKRNGLIRNVVIVLPKPARDRGTGVAFLSERHYDVAITHEYGHALGLAHDDSPMSVMHPTPDERLSVLWQADAQRLRRAYL